MFENNIVGKSILEINNIDAVVCSANNYLKGGSGIARALEIHAGQDYRKAGEKLLKSRNSTPLAIGSAHITGAGDLQRQGVKYIINAVAMGYTPTKQLIHANWYSITRAIESSLREANSAGCKSIIIPVMCAGRGVSATESTKWIIFAIRHWRAHNGNAPLRNFILNSCDFRRGDPDAYKTEWECALKDASQPSLAVDFLNLLQISRDEIVRLDSCFPVSANGDIISVLNQTIYAKSF